MNCPSCGQPLAFGDHEIPYFPSEAQREVTV